MLSKMGVYTFWIMEVCFRKSEFENESLFSNIAVENQNLFLKIGG